MLTTERARQSVEIDAAKLDEVRAEASAPHDLRPQRLLELVRLDQTRGRQQLPEPCHSSEYLRDCDVVTKVDVLDRLQKIDTFLERTLERLATGDEPHAAGALVDDGRRDRLAEVALTGRCTAR